MKRFKLFQFATAQSLIEPGLQSRLTGRAGIFQSVAMATHFKMSFARTYKLFEPA